MFFPTGSSMRSFIVSALVNEAKKDNVPIQLNYLTYTFKGLITYDAYFPKGLSIFGDTYRKPYYVQIKSSPYPLYSGTTSTISSILPKGQTKGTLFIIHNDDYLLGNYSDDMFDETVILGKDFVSRLQARNHNIYLNQLFGIETLSIRKQDDDTLYLSEEKQKGSEKKQSKTVKEPALKIEKDFPDEICENNENEFKAYLDKKSKKSNCAIIIGNGVSIPFGSDDWSSMIKHLVDYLEPFYIENHEHVEKALSESSYALSSFVKRTIAREETEDKFIEALRYCIYRKYNKMMHDQQTLVKAIALAKKKYPSLPLLTYNYDTFVERQYYHETKKGLNYFADDYKAPSFEELAINNVIHLHGYVSYSKNNHRGVVLADEDYCDAYLRKDSWTRSIQLETLKNFNCLFVGSSMSDLFQMSLIQEARKGDDDGKWNCFALMCLDLEFREKTRILKYYMEKGIKLIIVKKFDELPKKLAELFDVKM